MHRYLLGLALLFLSAIAACAQNPPSDAISQKPSDYLNEHLPPWIQLSGEFRIRFELFGNRGFNSPEDSYLLTRARFNLLLKPLSWLRFFGQTQDSHTEFMNVQHPGTLFQDPWDIRQAYVELGDSENGRAGLKAGRQEINLGDQRLVGSLDWTNTARSFDAVQLKANYDGYRADLFAASVVDLSATGMDHHTQGNDLHGAYGGIDKLLPGATIEPYILWRLAPLSLSPVTEHGAHGKLDEKTIGVRWVGKLPLSFDYGLEMARQFGSLGLDNIQAWAGHWVVGRTFLTERIQPRLLIEYNYASGDKNPADGVRGTFDQLYPTGHLRYGLTDQVGWKNIEDVHFGLETKPGKKWTANTGFHDYWLAQARDGLYNASSVLVARSTSGTAGRHVGEELEAYGTYNPLPTMRVGVGYGHLFTGQFLNATTHGHDFNYPYILLNYAF